MLACALAIPVAAIASELSKSRVLDTFESATAWTAVASDQVVATLRSEKTTEGNALCLDFDFHGVSGYAAMRRTLPIDYPANYEFTFRVRGSAPDNALQFKLGDASGDNVWWVNHPDFVFPHDWQTQRYRKRHVDFAWGPGADKTLRHSDSVEFTLYAGKGGRGEVCFDQLTLRELPPDPATWPTVQAAASSSQADSPPVHAIDGQTATTWRSDPKRGAEQWLTLDLGADREFGGVVLHWAEGAFASRYDIELSNDGKSWRTVRKVLRGNGGIDPLLLPESQARGLRIAIHDGPHNAYGLTEVDIKELSFGASANAFFAELAREQPRGSYPRGFYNEQTYWTVVGIDGGHGSGLLSEDGALEVARGGFSIEPFLIDQAGKLDSWADVSIAHTLQDRYLPMPSVIWTRRDLRLTTTAFASGTPQASQLIASYTVENTSDHAQAITLALAVQPFQVNPSVQFLNTPGGVSPIHSLAFSDGALAVDGKPRVFALETPTRFIASAFDAGMIVERLRDVASRAESARATTEAAVETDATGLSSGALLYRVELAAKATRTISLAIPLDIEAKRPTTNAKVAKLRAGEAAAWHRKLDDVTLRLPARMQALADTLRTALADILISRDGAALRPGTRSYARSWIRDGAMMSEALLRLGRTDVARDYLQWYAPYQFGNGKVPCCVDARGADPVPENDSHGELIHLANEVFRYSEDPALLTAVWPHVDAATRYMDTLRESERTRTNQLPGREAFFGLMPASISHEGYSAKPMHSYWDDFWALTGYKNAVDIATALGKRDDARRLTQAREEFRSDLLASIRKSVDAHGIDYLPGSAELGDFDATSTTIALSPAGEQAGLPQDLLHNTFERYWQRFVARRDGGQWKDYTPYEWRAVGTFVRLGWRARALEAIDFFMLDRRPAGWNQWAEVVGRDARESRFVGDMPHGWIASDFIRSALDLFAYEREADQSIVLAAGVSEDWLDGDGIAIDNLRTPYGKLGYSLRRKGRTLHLEIKADDMQLPPGGFVLPWLDDGAPRTARINGTRTAWVKRELRITRLPAHITIE
ncbi:MAG: discoidin domain-containing protein [Dokdonella sp.]